MARPYAIRFNPLTNAVLPPGIYCVENKAGRSYYGCAYRSRRALYTPTCMTVEEAVAARNDLLALTDAEFTTEVALRRARRANRMEARSDGTVLVSADDDNPTVRGGLGVLGVNGLPGRVLPRKLSGRAVAASVEVPRPHLGPALLWLCRYAQKGDWRDDGVVIHFTDEEDATAFQAALKGIVGAA